MTEINLKEAEHKLSELVGMVEQGEEVIIITDKGSSYKIVSMKDQNKKPKFGSAKNMIEISDDFDAPLDDFKEYME